MRGLLLIICLALVCQGCAGSRWQTTTDPDKPEFFKDPPASKDALLTWLDEHPVVKYGGITILTVAAVWLIVGTAVAPVIALSSG